jgi:hypothetical protein
MMDGNMLYQRGQRPDPETALQFRALARSLSQFLERELVSLESRKQSAATLKAVYDAVYEPILAALADGLADCGFSDLGILRERLCSPLASTQVTIVLEWLYFIIEVLGDE